MKLPVEMDREANSSGIDTLDIVREGLIEMRNDALDRLDPHAAVRLTHAIWWLSKFVETLAEGS